MKILFSGGGTLGPVTPLLAVIEELRAQKVVAEIFWIGTAGGVELPLLRSYGVTTFIIPAGKLRRYFSWLNFVDGINILRGLVSAYGLLKKIKPNIVVTTGGFVSVPVHYAAALQGIPQIVHQQDVEIGLANRLMSWVATKITVSIEAQTKLFAARKVEWIGNPVRRSVLEVEREAAQKLFKLDPALPTVFVFGGGTGSEIINVATEEMAEEASGQFQIIHVTGTRQPGKDLRYPQYHPYPFFVREMGSAYAAADLVVGRAGFSTISELAAWGKPAILIPKHATHQEKNAAWAGAAGAAVVLSEVSLTGENLLQTIREVFGDAEKYEEMRVRAEGLFPAGARERLVTIILALAKRE